MLHTRTRKVALAFLVLAVAVIVALAQSTDRGSEISLEDQNQAKEALFQALVAIRDSDVDSYIALLHSDSKDMEVEARIVRVNNRMRRVWGLDRLSDSDMRDSITFVENARHSLVVSMLDKFLDSELPPKWSAWEVYDPVVIRYSIHDISLVSVVLKENGDWKLTNAPLLISDQVLKYRSIDEANIGHGEAVAEEPFPVHTDSDE